MASSLWRRLLYRRRASRCVPRLQSQPCTVDRDVLCWRRWRQSVTKAFADTRGGISDHSRICRLATCGLPAMLPFDWITAGAGLAGGRQGYPRPSQPLTPAHPARQSMRCDRKMLLHTDIRLFYWRSARIPKRALFLCAVDASAYGPGVSSGVVWSLTCGSGVKIMCVSEGASLRSSTCSRKSARD